MIFFTLKKYLTTIGLAALCLLDTQPAVGGDATNAAPDFGALDLAQLASVKIDIESINPRPVSEQPGIVSVIQAAQIREMGARDLMDILQQVPGFGFGQDVNGVIGPSFRGLWAYEGKLQLIVDGVEFNESLYGNTELGHHIPADAIEQVEIIRGPGSAKYGGTAELAVIRVTTKGASQNGGYASVTPSVGAGKVATDYTGGFGYTLGDYRVSANAYVGENFRSNQRYTALDGTSFDMTHDSDIQTRMVNVDLGWKDLDVRLIYDLYQLSDRINFGEPLPATEPISFETLATVANYNWKMTDWLTVTPSVTYRRQTPWNGGVPGSTLNIVTERYIGELTAVANLSADATLLVGLRYLRDSAEAEDTSFYGVAPANFYNMGTSDSVAYDTYSAYGQFDWDLKWVNVTVGGRYENQSAVGDKFVPRLGLTKTWDRFHLKLLYDQAYRTPNINILSSPAGSTWESTFGSLGNVGTAGSPAYVTIKPETTISYQLEAGYVFNHGFALTQNIFYMEIKDPIVYLVDPGTEMDGYANGGKVSTYGTELELSYTQARFSATFGYSLYVVDQNTVAYWGSGDPRVNLGLPADKLSASATWHLSDALSWNVNSTFTTAQRAYFYPNSEPQELNSTFLLNSFVEYRWSHASLGFGVANLLDQDQYIAQPYAGGEAPILLTGREFYFKFAFQF
jgi:outer membrane receptor for ferrienterochelin and colicin